VTLTSLQSQRDQLAGQLAQLKQPQILEIRAREIGMLRRGEQGYVIDFISPKPHKSRFRVEMVSPRRSGGT
jgi:cell division protein FtsB